MFCSAKKSSKTEFYIDWMLRFGEGRHSSFTSILVKKKTKEKKIRFKNKVCTFVLCLFIYSLMNVLLLWTVLVEFGFCLVFL